MSHPAVVVLGSINTDLVIKGPRIPAVGETVLGGDFYRANGGKGANQAVAAARAGESPVVFIAAVGDDDFGRGALEAFRQENMDCRFLRVVSNSPSGVALILVDDQGRNCISVASGANAHLCPEDVLAIPDEVFTGARVFLACLESPLETVACGLRRAKQAGLLTILNPAPANDQLADSGMLADVDIITPNEPEASAISGRHVRNAETAAQAGKELLRRGCRAAVITMGGRGATVIDDKVDFVNAVSVEAVDTTAAGDAFNGALAVALSEGRDLRTSVRWASIAAGLSVTRRGAQPSLPVRTEIYGYKEWEK